MKLLNRLAVLVTPKEPYLEWATEVDWTPSSAEDVRESFLGPPTVYLADPGECDGPNEAISEETARRIFEAELASWHDDDDDWPKDRGLAALNEWFDVQLQGMVLDMEYQTLDLFHDE